MAFPNDSIVNYKGDTTFNIPMNLVEVYEKGGNLLLTLTPNRIADSVILNGAVTIPQPEFEPEVSLINT